LIHFDFGAVSSASFAKGRDFLISKVGFGWIYLDSAGFLAAGIGLIHPNVGSVPQFGTASNLATGISGRPPSPPCPKNIFSAIYRKSP
jgi:hypothetical protein